MPFHRVHQPVFVWTPGPLDPGWGVEPPVDPGYGRPGWGPVDPGFGVGGGFRPDNSLPGAPAYPSTGPIKPPGRPILPPHPDNGLPPSGHPWLPGHWEPIDPGFGKPPIFGWVPVDPGFGVGGPARPDNTLPDSPGHWVPTDPDYGKPVGPCGGHDSIPHPPLWAWIPEIGKDFGTLPAPVPPPATPK